MMIRAGEVKVRVYIQSQANKSLRKILNQNRTIKENIAEIKS